jgi:hypothetical protein
MAKPLLKKPSVVSGAVIDGFTVGECVHRGGMASLWSVTRADVTVPLLMKVPTVSEGQDPAAIVSFEMEQMILPRLSGVHVPKFVAAGDFAVRPTSSWNSSPARRYWHGYPISRCHTRRWPRSA